MSLVAAGGGVVGGGWELPELDLLQLALLIAAHKLTIVKIKSICLINFKII